MVLTPTRTTLMPKVGCQLGIGLGFDSRQINGKEQVRKSSARCAVVLYSLYAIKKQNKQ